MEGEQRRVESPAKHTSYLSCSVNKTTAFDFIHDALDVASYHIK